MAQQDDIMDVLSLSRALNNEIQDFNRNSVVGDSSKLPIQVIDPRKAVGNLIHNAPPPPPQPPVIRTADGMAVPPSQPLIPMPEGYRMPFNAPVPTPVTQPSQTPQQLEFGFPTTPVNEFLKTPVGKYLEENLTLINAKLAIISSQIAEILSRKRKKYERKTERVDEGCIGTQQTTTNPK